MDAEDSVLGSVWLSETARLESEVLYPWIVEEVRIKEAVEVLVVMSVYN